MKQIRRSQCVWTGLITECKSQRFLHWKLDTGWQVEIPERECIQLSSAFEFKFAMSPSRSPCPRSTPELGQPEPFSFWVGSPCPCPRAQTTLKCSNVQQIRLAAYQLRVMSKVIMAKIAKRLNVKNAEIKTIYTNYEIVYRNKAKRATKTAN